MTTNTLTKSQIADNLRKLADTPGVPPHLPVRIAAAHQRLESANTPIEKADAIAFAKQVLAEGRDVEAALAMKSVPSGHGSAAFFAFYNRRMGVEVGG